jgi:membrane-associated PAP2 superfamily phosphatase
MVIGPDVTSPSREFLVRVFALVLAGIALMATIVSMMGLNVDLAVARLFFDPTTQRFPAPSLSFLTLLRDHGYLSIVTCVGLLVAALAGRWLPPRWPHVSGRVAVFLVASLVLSSGILVNAILKEHWDRPRPLSVIEFGGDKRFVNWWNPRGACERNCSFASGEVASAAWMFGPAMLTPLPWRAAAFGAAAIFTIVIALGRMAAGAHFLTDVVFAALIMLFVLWLLHRLIFRTDHVRRLLAWGRRP